MSRKGRFIPDKVLVRDFRKWAKSEGYALPRSQSDDYQNLYVRHEATAEDMEEIFRAGFEAGRYREIHGGAGCGE
jgi:hypothetical protein